MKKLIKRLLKPVVLNKPTPHLIPVEEKNKAVPQAIPDGEVKDGTEKTEVKVMLRAEERGMLASCGCQAGFNIYPEIPENL